MKTSIGSILKEIEISEGYETALITTYNFEISFFEKYVFSLLARNEIRFINLFVDSKRLNESLLTENSFRLGRDYFVTPVAINGAFHPKVILLLGNNRAKLIVSSANIKTSGYMHNNEIYNVFEYSENNKLYAGLISSAISFFKDLFSIGVTQDKDIRQKIDSFVLSSEEESPFSLLFNTEEPIMTQLVDCINERIKRINIAVPFYDENLDGLKELIRRSGCDNAHLYIQNKKSTFPAVYNKSHNVLPNDRIHVFDCITENNNSKAFYHGKVLEIITDEASYILYGSTNCSSSALLRTYMNNGNIECDILAKSNAEDKNGFFKTFSTDDSLEPEEGFIAVKDAPTMPEYSFIYGESSTESVLLYFSYTSNKNIRIYYLDQELEHEFREKYLIVILPIAICVHEENTFELEFRYDEQMHRIKVWNNDTRKLARFRFFSNEIGLKDLSDDTDLLKYENYIQDLFDAMYSNKDWFNIAKKLIGNTSQKKNPDDLDENEIDEAFILDEDIDESYTEKRLDFAIYKNTCSLAGRYFQNLLKNRPSSNPVASSIKTLNYPVPARAERKATSAEKRLSRIFKRHISRFILLEKQEDLSYEYCKSVFGAILDLVERIYYRDKVKDFFDIDYILETKSVFAEILIKKAKNTEAFNDIHTLMPFVLGVLIEREYRGFNQHNNMYAEEAVYNLNKLKVFREDVPKEIESLNFSQIDSEANEAHIYSFGINYIDSLFGYKTKTQLIAYLKQTFNGDVDFLPGKRFLIVVGLPQNKLQKEGLSPKAVDEILRFIEGYHILVTNIAIRFTEANSQNKIYYEMKVGNKSVSNVMRYQYLNGYNYSFRCHIKNGLWRIDLDTRKTIQNDSIPSK